MNPPDDPQQYVAYPRAFGWGPRPRRVRIEAISESWTIIKNNLGVWIVSVLILFGVYFVMLTPYISVVFAEAIKNPGINQRDLQLRFAGVLLGSQLLMLFAVGFLNAGILRMAILAVRGVEVRVGDIFKLNGQAGKVAIAELILAVVGVIAPFISLIPAMTLRESDPITVSLTTSATQIVAYGLLGLLQIFCTFVPMLLVDKGLPLAEAFQLSFQAAGRNFWMLLLVLFLVSLLAGLGACACLVGVLFTQPFYHATRAIVYNDIFGAEGVDDPRPQSPSGTDFSVPPDASSL